MNSPSDAGDPPRRKHPIHGVAFIDGQPTIVFDTVCTKDRVPWLVCDEVHQLLCEVWRESTAWLMGRYMIMPEHIHYFAGATESPIEYENWVKYWKSQFTQRYTKLGRRMGGRGSRRAAFSGWQTDHWDTRVRSEQMYDDKWTYVLENPQRKGLVTRSVDWPYQGEIFELPWR